MAGVRDQDGRLGPVSMGNTQSWGEANAKPAHFTDVVAATQHYESRQLCSLPKLAYASESRSFRSHQLRQAGSGAGRQHTQPAEVKSLFQLARVQNP